MASNETSKYKLSVVEGTELKLSLNGAQGPAGPTGEVGPAGADGADGADALWNFRGEFDGVSFIHVTGQLTSDGYTPLVFPYLFRNGSSYSRPKYSSLDVYYRYEISYNGAEWFLFDNVGSVPTWRSTEDVMSPELVTTWAPVPSATGIPIVTKISPSYEIGDVVTYNGETWYCHTAYVANAQTPEIPETGSPYWQLLASKGGGGNYLPLAGGTMDANATVTLYTAPDGNGFGTDSEVGGWGFGVQQKEEGVNTGLYAYVEPNGFHAETTTTNSAHLSGDSLTFDNGSKLKKGTTDAGLGGNGGIALKCSVDYELKWEAGRLYTMEQDGFTIRRVDHCGTTTPTATDNSTKGFVIGSIWTLDNGTSFICTNAGGNSAVWVAHLPLSLGDGLVFTGSTNTLNTSTNVARRAGLQTFTGNNNFGTALTGVTTTFFGTQTFHGSRTFEGTSSFSDQVELTGQALTNDTSAVTRALGDARYALAGTTGSSTYFSVNPNNLVTSNTTTVVIASVTLPIGTYQVESLTAAFASATGHGGYLFSMRTSANANWGVTDTYGIDGGTLSTNVFNDSNAILFTRQVTSSTVMSQSRRTTGIIEVLTNNTVLSTEIQFNSNISQPPTPITISTRKRAYLIARKIA